MAENVCDKTKEEEAERLISGIVPRKEKHRIPVMRTEQDQEMPADHWEMEEPSF